MKIVSTALLAGAVLAGAVLPAAADSCADLWYARNLIYAQHGYCFSTTLGQRVFADYDCWTRNPVLEPGERQRVAAIKAEERRLRCKVNK